MLQTINLLRYLRLQSTISQSTLAEKSGISQPMISNYENGLSIPDQHRKVLLSLLSKLSYHISIDFDRIQPPDLERPYNDLIYS